MTCAAARSNCFAPRVEFPSARELARAVQASNVADGAILVAADRVELRRLTIRWLRRRAERLRYPECAEHAAALAKAADDLEAGYEP